MYDRLVPSPEHSATARTVRVTRAGRSRGAEPIVAIRQADDADAAAVARLAALDSAASPHGTVLLALVDGEPWAALAVEDGHHVADPFRSSAQAVELLRLRAAQLRAGARRAVTSRSPAAGRPEAGLRGRRAAA